MGLRTVAIILRTIHELGMSVLRVNGVVPGITAAQFAEAAGDAKANCPVSGALRAELITLEVGTFSA